MLQRYKGPINAGMSFRHRNFDIYCIVEKCEGGVVETSHKNEYGVKVPSSLPSLEFQFRSSWRPAWKAAC